MSALLATVIVASLVGSLHCVGMCGGFVAFYAAADTGRGGRLLSHLAYHGGRLVTYVALGAAAGGLGAGLDRAGTLLQLQRLAAVIAGGVMVVWGVAMLLPLVGLRLPRVGLAARLTALLQRLSARLGERPPVVRALLLGAMTTLLPCGWLWAFVIAAAGAGSALGGGAVMVAFWLGTVPALLGLGLGVRQAARLLGRYLPAMTALAVIAIGLVQLTGRLTMPGHHKHGHHPVPGLSAPSERPAPVHHPHGVGGGGMH